MQQAIQTKAISIERIGGKLTGQVPEFLFSVVWYAHIKAAFHQRFDGKQMGIDIFQISHRLMDRIRRLFSTTNRSGMGLSFSVRSAVLLL